MTTKEKLQKLENEEKELLKRLAIIRKEKANLKQSKQPKQVNKFRSMQTEELIQQYSLKQLREFYHIITNKDPFPKSVKKGTVADALRRCIRAHYSATAFLEHERKVK